MKKLWSLLLLFAPFVCRLEAQDDDLLKLLGEDEQTTEYVTGAFKSSRVINGHSMEMIPKGALDFRILHRFGLVSDGAYQFFGLDQASMRLGLDYGITKNFTVGIGRSTFKKEVDGFLKYRLLQQSTGKRVMPFSLVYVAGMTCDGMEWTDTTRVNYFSSRLGYYHELIIGRKFNQWLTLQLSPLYVHRNLVETSSNHNDLYSLGVGGRIKITKRIALTGDYYYNFNRNTAGTYDPLSFGVDIETGGHVFQLHFTNTTGMNERAFVADTQNRWSKGEIRFGFNLSRIFQLAPND